MKTKTGKQITTKDSHYSGGIVGCVHLGAHDIGRAKVGRSSVWFAWGESLDAGQAAAWNQEGFDTITNGIQRSKIIPLKVMERLRPVIVWSNACDRRALERQIKATK